MHLARLVLADSADRVDREERSEAPDRSRQGPEHATLRAIVAIIAVERIADEAAVAWLGAEQPDLTLKLHGRCGNERNPKPDASVADREPSREIVAAVDDEIVVGEEL